MCVRCMSATDPDQQVKPIVLHVNCIWPTNFRGQTHCDTHTRARAHTCKRTQLHRYAETDSREVRKVNKYLLFFDFSFCARSLSFQISNCLSFTMSSSCLQVTAMTVQSHSYDTSQSLFLAKCHRMKWQQMQRPWNKYKNALRRWEEQSGKDKFKKMQIYELVRMSHAKQMSKT